MASPARNFILARLPFSSLYIVSQASNQQEMVYERRIAFKFMFHICYKNPFLLLEGRRSGCWTVCRFGYPGSLWSEQAKWQKLHT